MQKTFQINVIWLNLNQNFQSQMIRLLLKILSYSLSFQVLIIT
jgi:hypothetical protein